MVKRRGVVLELFESRIKNTKEKEIVALESVYICRLTRAVLSVLGFSDSKVHINTKVLKHLYDKKPAEEFDFVIRNLHTIIKYPDHIYKKNGIQPLGKPCVYPSKRFLCCKRAGYFFCARSEIIPRKRRGLFHSLRLKIKSPSEEIFV